MYVLIRADYCDFEISIDVMEFKTLDEANEKMLRDAMDTWYKEHSEESDDTVVPCQSRGCIGGIMMWTGDYSCRKWEIREFEEEKKTVKEVN